MVLFFSREKFMKFKEIETERLLLRKLRIEDAEHIFKTWTGDERVTKFMIYTTHQSVEVTREWLAETIKHYDEEDSGSLQWGFQLKSTGMLIGSGGAIFKPEYQMYSIGYNIAYDYWGKGYTTEAVRGIIEYLKSIGIKQIYSDHAVDNPASGRVMEKAGMRYWKDGSYTCLDGRVFQAKFYRLDLE